MFLVFIKCILFRFKKDSDAASKLFHSSQREIKSRFPTADNLNWFLKSTSFFTVTEFLKEFYTPINVDLESENTWPVEPIFQF